MGNQDQPPNVNQNVQNIYTEHRESIIVFLTRGGVATRDDRGAPWINPIVRPTTQKKVPFDA